MHKITGNKHNLIFQYLQEVDDQQMCCKSKKNLTNIFFSNFGKYLFYLITQLATFIPTHTIYYEQ